MDINNLVFLDETSINTGMTRLYGRGLSNERVVEYVPDIRFERTTIMSSIRLNGDKSPLVFEGTLNGELFREYVIECLVPTLQRGDIVIMDNLTSHKVKGVVESINAVGASVLYLPPYSPDLNPIEMMWSKIKSYMRKTKARTREGLYEAIGEAFNLVTLTDIQSWFKESGYGIC
jgi:transposase